MGPFTQIMPLNSSGDEVAGYINAMNEEFYIHLAVRGNNVSRKVSLRGCPRLLELLKSDLDNLKQHLYQSNTIESMLSEIQNVLEQRISTRPTPQHSGQLIQHNALYEQLQECGWDSVQFISPDFRTLHLKAIDASEREHILKIHIPEKFPTEELKYECDLPEEFNYKWFPEDRLIKVYSTFEERLVMFAEFWENMDELDCNTWVLEPEKPRRKDCKRRIVLDSGISLLVFINPLMPTSVPACHYLGPERAVEPIRERFNANIRLWSEYDSVLTNLRQVLELEFPSPTSTTKEDFCTECGICYSYLLEEAIPDVTCENQSCSQPFHHACLYEYIRMLPDVKTSFNKLFGQCPYCSKPIWCTVL